MKSKDITTNEDFRSDQEDHLREFHLGEFKADLNTLLSNAYKKAYEIGGNAVGPGITRDLYKIAKVAVLDKLGNRGQ